MWKGYRWIVTFRKFIWVTISLPLENTVMLHRIVSSLLEAYTVIQGAPLAADSAAHQFTAHPSQLTPHTNTMTQPHHTVQILLPLSHHKESRRHTFTLHFNKNPNLHSTCISYFLVKSDE